MFHVRKLQPGANNGTELPTIPESEHSLSKHKKNRFFLFKPPTKNTVYSRKRLVEVKWKSALNSLEKDHQLLRADYLQLVDMVGQFLANCSTKMLIRSATNPLNSNIAVLAAFYSSDGT